MGELGYHQIGFNGQSVEGRSEATQGERVGYGDHPSRLVTGVCVLVPVWVLSSESR